MADILEPDALGPQAGKPAESSERFQAYFQLAPYGILVTDQVGRIIETNEACASIVGYSVQELVHLSIPDLAFPEHVPLAKQVLGEMVDTGSMNRTVRMRRKDGALVWVHIQGGRYAADRFIGFVREVTEQLGAQERQLDNESKLRRLSDSMRDFVAELDLEGRFLYVSPSYAKYLNLASEQLLGQWVVDRVHPDDRADLLDKLRLVVSGVPDVDSLFRYMDGYGGWRWIESRGGLSTDPGMATLRIVLSSRDVTDRQMAVQARQNTEVALRAFLDSIPDLAFIKDENLTNIYLNASYLQFLGRTLEEAIGKTDAELLPAEFANTCRTSDRRALERQDMQVEEEDMGEMVFESTKFPLRMANGSLGLGGIARNVTEKRRSREQLEHRLQALTEPIGDVSDLRFSDLFDIRTAQALMDGVTRALGVGSMLTDAAGRPLTRRVEEPHVCQLLRSSGIRCIGTCSFGLGSAPLATAITASRCCPMSGLWFGTTPLAIEGRIVAYWTVGWVADESASDSERMATALALGLDERGYVEGLAGIAAKSSQEFSEIVGFVAMLAQQLSQLALRNLQQARHIQDLRSAQEERRRLEEQLQHAQKMEAIGRLAGGIAHDFGNLLTTIIGNLALSQMELHESSPVQEYLSEIQTAAQRAENLTRQVLAFSRRQVIDYKVLNPNQIVLAMGRLLSRLLGEDIHLELDAAPEVGAILADAGQLEQIIANLMVNARDAMPAGGTLTVRTYNSDLEEPLELESWTVPSGTFVVLEVSDSGTGMTDDVKKHLFEPFFTTKGKEKGTGLGLAIVYGAVIQHRAHVLVDSHLGQGTAIRIYFPRVSQLPAQEAEQAEFKHMPGQETLLVVEDDLSLNLATTRGLQRLGYTVFSETHPARALEFVRQYVGPLHAVVSDVVMPDMSGDVLCSKIVELRPGIATILTSGYTDNRMAETLVVGGSVQFVRKPYSLGTLTSMLRQVLGSQVVKHQS